MLDSLGLVSYLFLLHFCFESTSTVQNLKCEVGHSASSLSRLSASILRQDANSSMLESLSLGVFLLEKIIGLSCAFSLNFPYDFPCFWGWFVFCSLFFFFWNGVSDGMFGITALQNDETLMSSTIRKRNLNSFSKQISVVLGQKCLSIEFLS